MRRQFVQIALLTGVLIVGFVSVTLAEKDPIHVSIGVMATVTTLDAKTGMAP